MAGRCAADFVDDIGRFFGSVFKGSVITKYRPSTAHEGLGSEFFDPVQAAGFPQHIMRYRNQHWADKTGLGDLSADQWVSHFGRFVALEGSFSTPLALRYHGHQFRHYNPELGDGRGFLLAQFFDDGDRLLDLGTKGSGPTPWSRGGDGRLTLKGGVREVLATAMLEALGVNTSKSFSLIETGEELVRGDEPSPARSAVLVRLNHSHIRIGSFQRQSYLGNTEELSRLLAHCVRYYYPDCARETEAETAATFVGAVCKQVAITGAGWMAAGFVHGVLNTDNINITGESFDYGPWRFIPTYDPQFTAAYFDETGLYAYGRQGDTLGWNLARLAECLLPLSTRELLEPALNVFGTAFREALAAAYLERLGLVSGGLDKDIALIEALVGFMGQSQMPYEQVLFDWRGGLASEIRAGASPIAASYALPSFAPFKAALADYVASEDANVGHDYFARATPRTMLIEDMEAIWAPIAEGDDWSAFEAALVEMREMGVAYGHISG